MKPFIKFKAYTSSDKLKTYRFNPKHILYYMDGGNEDVYWIEITIPHYSNNVYFKTIEERDRILKLMDMCCECNTEI